MSEFGGGGQRGIADDARSFGDKLGPRVADAADKVAEKARAGDFGDVADEVKGAAGDLKSAAIDHGKALYESAKDQATGFVDQRKSEAAQSVSDLAASLRETGRSFGDKPNINAFVGSAADGLEQLATTIQERSFADLYADAERYARRSPMTVAAVAAVAGFILARFIKSTSDELAGSTASGRTGASRDEAARRPPPSNRHSSVHDV